jgi:hypothetical protein
MRVKYQRSMQIRWSLKMKEFKLKSLFSKLSSNLLHRAYILLIYFQLTTSDDVVVGRLHWAKGVGFRRMCALRKNPSPLEKAATKIRAKNFAWFDFRSFIFWACCQILKSSKFNFTLWIHSFYNSCITS